MTEQPMISAELRGDLCKVWAEGFIDALKGAAPQHTPGAAPQHTPGAAPQHTPPEHTPSHHAPLPPPNGRPATDDDCIASELAPSIIALAEQSIEGSQSMIASVFAENPQLVFSVVYGVGYDLCMALNAAHLTIDINLN